MTPNDEAQTACTDALLAVLHRVKKAADDQDANAAQTYANTAFTLMTVDEQLRQAKEADA